MRKQAHRGEMSCPKLMKDRQRAWMQGSLTPSSEQVSFTLSRCLTCSLPCSPCVRTCNILKAFIINTFILTQYSVWVWKLIEKKESSTHACFYLMWSYLTSTVDTPVFYFFLIKKNFFFTPDVLKGHKGFGEFRGIGVLKGLWKV